MWVWQSIPPGTTYLPVASMTRSAPDSADVAAAEPGWSTAEMVVPSTRPSAVWRPVALTTVPFLIIVVICSPLGATPRGPLSIQALSQPLDDSDQHGPRLVDFLLGDCHRRGDAQHVAVKPSLADQ